jgi:hypothetical protein
MAKAAKPATKKDTKQTGKPIETGPVKKSVNPKKAVARPIKTGGVKKRRAS